VQAFGKIPFRADRLDLDLVSVSGHKIHAPKGVGALYVKKGARILPRLFGGGQQKELRPGTENVPLICGFGLAASLAARELDGHYDAVSRLNGRMREGLGAVEGAVINSPGQGASPYILNFSLPGYRSETLLHMLESRGVYVSSGSACSKGKPSHALTEAGLPPVLVDSAVRVSFSRYSTEEDVDALLLALSEGLPALRRAKY
jgi:cysteine desulfurase